MTNPRTQLRELNDISHRLLTTWTRFAETHDALTHTNSDRLGVHGGPISDPTYGRVHANERMTETCTDISEALGILRRVEARVATANREHPATARLLDAEARAARCADPVCTDNAVKHGHCERHWWTHRTSCTTCSSGAAV